MCATSSTTSSTRPSSRYATLTTDEMAVMGGWSGYPGHGRFPQWRWSSHIEEHTIQIEKTIDMLGHRRQRSAGSSRLNARRVRPARRYRLRPRAPQATRRRSSTMSPRELDVLRVSVVAAAAAAVPAEDW